MAVLMQVVICAFPVVRILGSQLPCVKCSLSAECKTPICRECMISELQLIVLNANHPRTCTLNVVDRTARAVFGLL